MEEVAITTSPNLNNPSQATNWPGVLEFLIKEYRNGQIKESEWELEKKELSDRNKQLEGQLTAQQSLNEDLMRRIKMLEYGIKKERMKFVSLINKNNMEDREKILKELRKEEKTLTDEMKQVLEKSDANQDQKHLNFTNRRARKQKEFLEKILTQFDCSDIIEQVFKDDLDGQNSNGGDSGKAQLE